MSRRRSLEHHRQSLGEIRDIMNSMKTLAYMETRKLSRFIDAQQAVVQSLEAVATDLLSFHPDILPTADKAIPVFLLIGAERGFCGDFNHSLLRHLSSSVAAQKSVTPTLIAIGHKLHTLLEGDQRVSDWIEGASVVEEINPVLNQLLEQILKLQQEHGTLEVYSLYHGSIDGVVMQRILPPFQDRGQNTLTHSHAPILNLSAAVLLQELTEQYLFAALHAMLYTSLMMENRHRVSHLERAVNHLDEQSQDLARQGNALRQEEIIEEIEVILLSASSLGPAQH